MISIAVAFVPLALYFFALTAFNSGRCPRMLTGQEDLTVLALGLIGFVMTGPMLYVLPVDALAFWGFYTWFFLAVLYALMVWFLGTVFRFRIVIYNIGMSELREILEKIGREIDSEARWAGNSLSLPTPGIQFYMEHVTLFRNVTLKACGSQQNMQGWIQFEKSLRNALLQHRVAHKNRVAMLMAMIGFLMLTGTATILVTHSAEALQSLWFLLQ
ncbi:MAG: hypothetical protein FWH27_01280 [Planctomycetaceae bacterium]|nr:hypothetical protein [Planctomycetaceae bacterium]